jgi:hypothetical protein
LPRAELRWPGRTSQAAVAAAPSGTTPSAPTSVTSITKDSAATLSFLAPASAGSSSITSYTATPYIAGAAQTPVTTAVGSAGSITGSNGNTYVQIPVTGLANSTAYTFSVHASNSSGAGPESGQSGANTPLSGLVFGDDFNGPSGGPIDPEWYVYNRCGYIAQNEIEWYLPGQVALDGSSSLLLTATKTAHSGPSYPSDGNTVRNQSWLSGACQSNTRTFAPASGNTMTFEAKQQVCPDIGGGMWPGLFWLEGNAFLNAWKTDPNQTGWDSSGKAELDVAEWNPTQVFAPHDYLNNSWISSSPYTANVNTATDFSAALHAFTVKWKPGVSVTFLRDGTQTGSTTSQVPDSTASFFLLLYLQILAGSATATQSCKIDYVRVWDQNLG